MSKFVRAAIIRAIRTFAQTALSLISVGAMLSEVDWGYVASVSAVALIYSVLTSIVTGLPEVDKGSDLSSGDLYICNNGDEPQFLLDLNQLPSTISEGDRAVFDVKIVDVPKEKTDK